jgi:hypothetical protein
VSGFSVVDLSRLVPQTTDYSTRFAKDIKFQSAPKEATSSANSLRADEKRTRFVEKHTKEDFKKSLYAAVSGAEVPNAQNKTQVSRQADTNNVNTENAKTKVSEKVNTIEKNDGEILQAPAEKGIEKNALVYSANSTFNLLATNFKSLPQNINIFDPLTTLCQEESMSKNSETNKALGNGKGIEQNDVFCANNTMQIVAGKGNTTNGVLANDTAIKENNFGSSITQDMADSIPVELGLEKISFIDSSKIKGIRVNDLSEKMTRIEVASQKESKVTENRLPELVGSQLPRAHRLEELVLRAVSIKEETNQVGRQNVFIKAIGGTEEVSVGRQNLQADAEVFSAANRVTEGAKENFSKDFLRPLNQTAGAGVQGEVLPQTVRLPQQQVSEAIEPLIVEGIRLEVKVPVGVSEPGKIESASNAIGVETVKQISQAVLDANAKGMRVLELDLRPAELGRIRLRLTDAGAGADGQGLRVEIMAMRTDTHGALTLKLSELRESLRGWDVRVTSGALVEGPRALTQVSEPRQAQPGWNDNQNHTPQRDAWDQNREGRSSSQQQADQEYVEFADRLGRAFTA